MAVHILYTVHMYSKSCAFAASTTQRPTQFQNTEEAHSCIPLPPPVLPPVPPLIPPPVP